MDYTQERVATLHDYGDAHPDAPTERATVVVPMTEREYGGLAPESVLSTLETLDVDRVVVPLRASAEKAGAFADWLDSFDVPLDVLWCNGPRVADLLDEHGLNGDAGKGRDIWLALGTAADSPYVAVHDADTKTYSARDVPKLLHPLDSGFDFVKGYYARVENQRLYGRLFRLCYEPLVEALDARSDEPVLDYLGAFRYALAGECAMTSGVAHTIRVPRTWGLEVGTLGEAYDAAGFDGTAQVDLGRYEHDHRAVSGPSGLSDMSAGVVGALLRACEDHGVNVDYDTLPERYRETAHRYVRGYAADAAFNDLDYDPADERAQVAEYADAVRPPTDDDRLPAWRDTALSPDAVREAAAADLDAVDS
ncbi:glycosyl transferase family 2 [Salarchaeum sp. JOR-1]|uniref:glycosyl transferase family 2 n=1 Tax=Salarchaeum sp. JOR-1 TaxID=2599399 RepID=UPI001198B2A5|nr:glycosyl transferase family 2 [Salarchaeum sp. JOR-1]QDX39788.1 glycosyl transferase family 2 [Salarchaeum sp. JOR-1]